MECIIFIRNFQSLEIYFSPCQWGEVHILRENREKTVLDTWIEVLKPQSEERTDVDIYSYFLSSVYRSQNGIRDKKRKNAFQVREAWKYRGVA